MNIYDAHAYLWYKIARGLHPKMRGDDIGGIVWYGLTIIFLFLILPAIFAVEATYNTSKDFVYLASVGSGVVIMVFNYYLGINRLGRIVKRMRKEPYSKKVWFTFIPFFVFLAYFTIITIYIASHACN